jgi:hypothetical protein
MPVASAARQSAPRRVASRREQDIETLQVLHQLGLDRLTPYAHARPHGHTLWSSERQPRPKAVLWAPEQSPFAAHELIVLETLQKTSLLLPSRR